MIACAPRSSAEDEKVEQCYDDNEKAMADSDSKYQIVTGDSNANIGRTLQKYGDIWNGEEK